ncbi:TetR/AcrR family transcriptional regulator [Streptomyces sp. NBC_01795]|uniref:TetR/AcrR family transcriptional regulator n=1 Tax=unclassified Streptomyces TaxID=2593676 RepID=UPI002DD7D079|nr:MULTISPECIES: TetR/AcrR family transcriptional regulator [unclassified Streptomyces]WSA94686.1 TetR/AcrR family transcriptional regulator [Streptomyces sp. NBC_01795]WSB79105.1 TetR/AcrR family transcriptional regulator [Streptomyces sp. NBC_01775]WSS12694.1 TetR/AcrR family transcriptional regulator [Streptomyces sp. NBC_01186]
MPRTADHEGRRRQIAAAVCELISEHGLDAVTVARTAATAGMSVGLVQHYFRTKDEMLLHAFNEVSARIRLRAEERIRAGIEHRRPIARVTAGVLAEFIPLDETRRTEFRVTRAFAGRALDAPALATVDVETAQRLREDIAQAVHNGKECGEVEADVDPWPAAIRLTAVTEGLAMQIYRDPAGANGVPAAELSTSIIDAELAAVFTGECRQYVGRADA